MKTKMILVDDVCSLEEEIGLSSDELWGKKVNLDDWDYAIIIPLQKQDIDILEYVDEYQKKVVEPEHTYLQNLLRGCCSNDWFKIENKKNEWFLIGFAYHA